MRKEEMQHFADKYFSYRTMVAAAADYARTINSEKNIHMEISRLGQYCMEHPEFELEMVCAYLDKLNGFKSKYPQMKEAM